MPAPLAEFESNKMSPELVLGRTRKFRASGHPELQHERTSNVLKLEPCVRPPKPNIEAYEAYMSF